MFIDMENYPRASTTIITLNGEVIGCLVEADTSAGYVIQARYSTEPVYTGKTSVVGKTKWRLYNPKFTEVERVKREGRVDIIGDTELDSPRVRFDRLNKVRSELGLPLIPESPFIDEK